MAFPNATKAIRELIIDRLDSDSNHVVLWLPEDTHEKAVDKPVVHIQPIAAPGTVEHWERQDNLVIDVYANGVTNAYETINCIRDAVIGSHSTSEGLLDDVFVIAEPSIGLYDHERIRRYTATFAVITRLLPTR